MRQRAHDCTGYELQHSLRCGMSSIIYPFAFQPSRTHTVWLPRRPPSPKPLSLRCHLVAMTLVLCLGYQVFHNQSKNIGILNKCPSGTPGSAEYLQPTAV